MLLQNKSEKLSFVIVTPPCKILKIDNIQGHCTRLPMLGDLNRVKHKNFYIREECE